MTAITLSDAEPGMPRAVTPEATAPERMPEGLALSATLHVGMLLLIAFGLPSLFHHPPPQETPIAVQLVTIAPQTRATQPNPFHPKPDAKPDLATAPPAPKPEPKPEPPSPAEPPSAAAAPPPMPAPPEKPEIRTPQPTPLPPPPKPVAQQTPPPPPPRPPEAKPQQAHHTPRPEARKSDPAAFDKLLKNLEEKKIDPADFDALLKNLTKQQVAQMDEPPPPTPRRTTAAAPPSSQPKAPLGSQLTASELDALIAEILRQLTPCWNIPAGARDARDLVVEIKASVNADGTVREATVVDRGRMGDPLYRAAAESARRTFFNPRCTPLKLPPDKYEVWKDLVVDFNPKDIL